MVVVVGRIVDREVNLHKGKKCSRGGPKSVKVLPREELDLIEAGFQGGPVVCFEAKLLIELGAVVGIHNPLGDAAILVGLAHGKGRRVANVVGSLVFKVGDQVGNEMDGACDQLGG